MYKRTAALMALCAAFLMAGCQRIEEDNRCLDEKVFHASFETPGVETKTYLDSDHKLLWTADDRLSIFDGNAYNQQYRFKGNTGDNSGDFDEVHTSGLHSGNDISTNYAVYPYAENVKISNGEKITLSLPAVQQYADKSFGLGANTMVAVTNGTGDNFLAFKNLCGYLVIKLYGEGTVRNITLKGNNGEKIAGAATVTASYGQSPSVSMNDAATTGITVASGNGVTLGTTAKTATEFWFCIPPVTFSKGFSIRVTNTVGGVMEKSISSSRSISRNTISSMSALEVEFTEPVTPVPEMVDLGLPSGLKWASFNLGASKPEEYGGYYQWGGLDDVTDTSIYLDWSNCPYHTGSNYKTGWSKYVPSDESSYWSGSGSPDNKTVFGPEDDVAHVKLGGKWRIPTDAEWTELRQNCSWTWTNDYNGTGVKGYIVTSKITGYTDKSIFLPAAGYRNFDSASFVGSYGFYWSSSLDTVVIPHIACSMYFYSDGVRTDSSSRYGGLSVRPVSE